MEWWQATEDEIMADPAMVQARQAAHYSVFYATAAGREVLAYLTALTGDGCWARAHKKGLTADEFLCYSSLIGKIKANAGIDDVMAIIKAESQVARSRIGSQPAETETKEKEDLLEI